MTNLKRPHTHTHIHARLLQTKHARSCTQNETPRSLPTFGHRSARPHVATAPQKQQPANQKPQQQQQQTGKRALCAHKQQQTVASYAGTPLRDAQLIGHPLASDRRPPASHGTGCGTHSYVSTATCVLCVRGGEGRGEGREGILLPRSLRSKYR